MTAMLVLFIKRSYYTVSCLALRQQDIHTEFHEIRNIIVLNIKTREGSSGLTFCLQKHSRPLAAATFVLSYFTSQPMWSGMKFSMSPQEAPRWRCVGGKPSSVLQMKVEPRPICLKFSSLTAGSAVIPAADVMSRTLDPHCYVVNHTRTQHTEATDTVYKYNMTSDSETGRGKEKVSFLYTKLCKVK